MTAPVLPLTQFITADSSNKPKDRVLSAVYGNGFEQRAADGLNATMDCWTINYKPLDGTNLTTLQTFLNTVGVTTWFTWTPFGESVSKKWRIDPNSKSTQLFNFTKIQISFTMTQCFDLGT